MISVKKSKYGTKVQASPKKSNSVSAESGTNSKLRIPKDGVDSNGFRSESGLNTGQPNTSVSQNPIGIDMEPMLVGLVPANYNVLFSLYRDIYYNDAVGGSAADLMSSLPFGDFSLGGLDDDNTLSIYAENMERLSVKTLLPEMSIDYLALGSHTHSLLYNKEKKTFVDLMTYAPENLKIDVLPFYSHDPIITASFPASAKSVLSLNSPRIERIKKLVGEGVFEKIRGGSLELDPLSTVYIPRKTFSDTDIGVSYFRRLLPWYLIEKNLYRGTLVESARRQRGIMHLTIGDGEEWIASPADMDFMTDLFMGADNDPLGAIVTTRPGVAVEEIRQGGDFWKVNDFADGILPHKLRALGISEAFLSGDANYNSADTSVSIFINNLLAYREMFTRKFFYEKLFPLISMVNGITVNAKGKVVRREGLMDSLSPEEILFRLNDGSKLLIPTVSWAKQLKPEGDSSYMEMLNTLGEKGVPIPLRIMAAAGGLNLDELLKQKTDDLAIRKKLKEYADLIKEINPEPAEDEAEADTEGEEESTSSSRIISKRLKAFSSAVSKNRSAVQATGGKVPLLNRDFGNDSEITGTTKTGKRRLIVNQRAASEKVNTHIAKAIKTANARKRMAAKHIVSMQPPHRPGKRIFVP